MNNLNEKYKNNKIIEKLNFDSNNMQDLFDVGFLFASGAVIKKANIKDLDLDKFKSFEKMLWYWIKNFKSPEIQYNNDQNNVFFIFPEQINNKDVLYDIKEQINIFKKKGYNVYTKIKDIEPYDHFGYRTCNENANLIGNSKNVYVYYDKADPISAFYLGVAYYFKTIDHTRTIKFINDNSNDEMIENILKIDNNNNLVRTK